MEGSSQEKNWEYVLMPWEDETTITVSESGSDTHAYMRWEIIQKQLGASKISNVQDLINVIKSYNVVFAKNGQQEKPPWKCPVLSQYFTHIDEIERKKFFGENGVLSTIRNLSLQLRKLVPRLRLLRSGFNSSITLHQLQIASILSSAFLCTFPKGNADCPSINFNTLYEGTYGSVSNYYIEKLKCLLHYFKRIHERQPSGNLSFYRHNIPDHKFPRWDKTTANLCELVVDVEGKIEDQHGFLQMDFANKYVGGGVLGRGCVQEEIRFLISPELIASRLFTECLADNESIFVVGAERYCDYTGYSNTFAFAGNYEDKTPFDENRHRKIYLIILDALYFHNSSDQYRESKILRELKKAYVGFKTQDEYKTLPLATGNWGCGAFGGDPQLKVLLQLIASSQTQRQMLYLTFGNFHLKNQIEECYMSLKEKAVNIGMLYRIIRLYNRQRKKNQTVFEFVKAALHKLDERRSTSKSTPSTSRGISSSFEFLPSAQVTKIKRNIDILGKEEQEAFPEMDVDFEALDREVQNQSFGGRFTPTSNHSSSQQKHTPPQESINIVDILWYESERECNSSAKGQQEEPPSNTEVHPARENSPSLFSDEDMDVDRENYEKTSLSSSNEKNQTLDAGPPPNFSTANKNENEILQKVQSKKVIQTKITDCFSKK